ncbi:Pol, partial [Symbiodinium sp. CCMP2456]
EHGHLIPLEAQDLSGPRFLDINPGRLALVQATHRETQLPISIVGIYQHVWRTHLTSSRNRELRQTVWAQLETALQRVPSRHALLICGDFNSTLTCEPPLVGSAIPKSSSHTEDGLQALLYKHSLCALNTWHCKPHCTYHSSTGQTQIDYVLACCADTGRLARTACPDHTFPVGGDRLSGHYPVRVHYPLRPFSRRNTRPKQSPAFDAQALCTAVRSRAPLAQELQHRISHRLQDVDTSVLSSARQHVNRILLEETCLLFPAKAAPDNRISAQPAFRITARAVWGLYRDLKHSGVCTFRNIFTKWRLATQFARASRALRHSSRQLKKQFFLDQVEAAEQAAHRGDQRGRLRDDSGRLLTRDEELEAIVKYGNATFARHFDDRPILPLTQDVTIPAADLAAELSKLGVAKAVPKHIAPSAVWKLCSSDLGEVLSRTLAAHLRRGTTASLDTDWKDCSVVWIPKPNKPPQGISSLRPIGGPLISSTRVTRFQQQAGHKQRGCTGGVSLSLDLSKALSDITLILETLESLHMVVNFEKTAILLHLVGKESKQLRRDHTFMKAGQLHLKLCVHGRERAIPIRDQHVYLGTVVTYHNKLERNMEHRTKAARANYQGLRKLLNGAHTLEKGHRIRLWKACQLAAYAIASSSGDSLTRAPLSEAHVNAPIQVPPTAMYGDPMDAFVHEEAEIFAGLWTGQEPYLEVALRSARPPPPRPMHHLQNHINLLGRVVLQQEDIISRLRNDKNLMLFMRNDANGTLGTLMEISRDWKAKKSLEPDQLKSPLRTVLIACMLRELMNLAQQAVATEETRSKHVTLEWLNSEGNWNYRCWNTAERRLETDKKRTPLQHAEAMRLLNFLLKCMCGDIVQRFAASKTLNFLEQQGAQAQEVYDALDRFTGSALMNLIGVSMKRDTMPRSPLAKKLAEQVYPSHSSQRPFQR